jgi:4-hydroxybenzoate polyprenyltransferase
VHPFPSVLDGAVVAGVAVLAGASVATAVTLGGSMVLLQFAIGAANDIVDAPRDAGHKPGKPIPAGAIGRRTAIGIAVACAVAGILAAGAIAPAVAGLGCAVLAIGLAYDLRFKGTPLSWLPFAIGIPILPVYGWLGATGGVSHLFALIVPVAFVEGAALAIANASVDRERDREAGAASVATALGARKAAGAGLVLQLAVALVAVVAARTIEIASPWLMASAIAAAALVAGAEMGRREGRSAGATAVAGRERAWQVQALAAGALAVCWLAGAVEAGRF